MKPWAFTVISGLSLLLLLAAVAITIHSHWTLHDSGVHVIGVMNGEIVIRAYDLRLSHGSVQMAVRRITSRDPKYIRFHGGSGPLHVFYSVYPSSLSGARGWWSFSADRTIQSVSDVMWAFHMDSRYVEFPVWVLLLLLSLLPGSWTVRYRKRRYRLRHHLCPACGYDLRATSDRCPECGRPVAADAGGCAKRP